MNKYGLLSRRKTIKLGASFAAITLVKADKPPSNASRPVIQYIRDREIDYMALYSVLSSYILLILSKIQHISSTYSRDSSAFSSTLLSSVKMEEMHQATAWARCERPVLLGAKPIYAKQAPAHVKWKRLAWSKLENQYSYCILVHTYTIHTLQVTHTHLLHLISYTIEVQHVISHLRLIFPRIFIFFLEHKKKNIEDRKKNVVGCINEKKIDIYWWLYLKKNQICCRLSEKKIQICCRVYPPKSAFLPPHINFSGIALRLV